MARARLRQLLRTHPDRFILAIGMAAAFVLWMWGVTKEMWFDERFVQVVAQRPLMDMFRLLRFENNPPFVFLLTHAWMALIGSSPATLRMLTLIPTLLTLVVARRFVVNLFGRGLAAVVVGLLAVSGQVGIQSLELRMYPWVMLWSVLALWLTWRYAQTSRRSDLTWLCIVHVLGLYTHYTYVFILISTGAWLLFVHQRQRLQILIGLIGVGLLFLPWVALSVWAKLTDLSSNVGIQRIAASRPQAAWLPLNFILPAPLESNAMWVAVRICGGVVIALGLLIFLQRLRRSEESKATQYLGIVIGVVVVGLVLTGIVATKYASILIVPVVIAVAYGLLRAPAPGVLRGGAIIMLVVFAGGLSIEQVRQPNVTYALAANVIAAAEKNSDRVLIYPFNDTIAFNPVYSGSLPVRGFFPLKGPSDTTVEDIVRYNFRVTLTTENSDQLTTYVGDAPRVWFLFDVPPSAGYWHGDLITKWFADHGYTSTTYLDIFHNVPPLLIRYDKVGA